MKIALVLWELDITGGTQRLALELAKNMQALGHSVDIYCYFYDKDIGYTDLYKNLQIKNVTKRKVQPTNTITKKNIPGISSIIYFYKLYIKIIKNFFYSEEPIIELKNLMTKKHPIDYYDVINLHDYNVYKVARLIKHKNIVWTMNDIQRPPIESKSSAHKFLYNLLQKIISRIEVSNIKNIIVLDYRNKNLCKNYYNKESIVVRGAIDTEMFDSMYKKRFFDKKIFNIFLSSIFFPYRRFEDVIEAAAILKNKSYNNFNIQINGIVNRNYEYYVSIKNLIAKKNLNDCIFITTGLQEKELLIAYLNADIFIFPNHNQTWGLAVFEAMLAGCVAIVSKTSGASEILTNGENAFLVNPKSPNQIADTLINIFNNPTLSSKVSQNATVFVKENLSWTKYAQEVLGVFEIK